MPNVLAFCITETFLGPEVNSGEIKIQGFDLFRRDRSGKGGGVAVYLRSEIKAEQIALASPSEAILLKCRVQKITFYLSVVYRPPGNRDPLLIPQLFDEIVKVMVNKESPLCICGDFNLPYIDWEFYKSNANYMLCDPFLHKVSELSFQQHVHQPTHNKGNILDLVFTNTFFIARVDFSDPLYSDHGIICMELDMNIEVSTNKNMGVERSIVKLYSKTNMEEAKLIFLEYEEQVLANIEKKPRH